LDGEEKERTGPLLPLSWQTEEGGGGERGEGVAHLYCLCDEKSGWRRRGRPEGGKEKKRGETYILLFQGGEGKGKRFVCPFPPLFWLRGEGKNSCREGGKERRSSSFSATVWKKQVSGTREKKGGTHRGYLYPSLLLGRGKGRRGVANSVIYSIPGDWKNELGKRKRKNFFHGQKRGRGGKKQQHLLLLQYIYAIETVTRDVTGEKRK